MRWDRLRACPGVAAGGGGPRLSVAPSLGGGWPAMFPVLLPCFAGRDGAWSDWLGRGYAVAVVSCILLQGVARWSWRLRPPRAGRRTMPLPVRAVYRRLSERGPTVGRAVCGGARVAPAVDPYAGQTTIC